MILNARAENGSSSEECLTTSLPSRSTPLIGGISSRRRHILYDCIQKLLYALVLVCASAAYRNSGTFAGSLFSELLSARQQRAPHLPDTAIIRSSSSSQIFSTSSVRYSSASSFISSGISMIEISSPLSSL